MDWLIDVHTWCIDVIQPSRPTSFTWECWVGREKLLASSSLLSFFLSLHLTSHSSSTQMAPTTLRANKASSKTKATAAGAGASSSPKTTTTTTITSSTTTTTTTASASTATTPEAPKLKNLAVHRYATWLEENQLKKTAVWIAVAAAVLVRCTVGLGPYSGTFFFLLLAIFIQQLKPLTVLQPSTLLPHLNLLQFY